MHVCDRNPNNFKVHWPSRVLLPNVWSIDVNFVNVLSITLYMVPFMFICMSGYLKLCLQICLHVRTCKHACLILSFGNYLQSVHIQLTCQSSICVYNKSKQIFYIVWIPWKRQQKKHNTVSRKRFKTFYKII